MRLSALVRDDRLKARQLHDDRLRTRGEARGDLVDERRDRHREPARRQDRHGQEDERPEQDQLLPAFDDGPRVDCESALPQHQRLTIPPLIPF